MKRFEEPKIDVQGIEVEDVITTSNECGVETELD